MTKEFQISELKTGHLVVTKSRKFIVFNDTATVRWDKESVVVYVDNGKILEWDLLKDALSCGVIKVYAPTSPSVMFNYRDDEINTSNWKLVWNAEDEEIILKLDGVDYSKSTLRSLIKKAVN